MKVFKWIILVFVAAVVLAMSGLYVFIRHFDANQYKDRIIQELSAAVNRPVAIGNIALELDWSKGVNLELDDFSVLEKSSSVDRIASVSRVQLGVDLAVLIRERKLTVTLIRLVEPHVRYIQYADRSTNMDGFIEAGKSSSEESPSMVTRSASDREFKLNDFKISSIEIEKGRVLLETHSADNVQVVELSGIDLSIQGFAADRNFPVRLGLSAFSDRKNIKVESHISISPSRKLATISNLHSTIVFNSFDGEKLLKAFPVLKESGVEFPLAGELLVRIDQILLSETGLESYKGEVRLNDGKLKLDSLSFPIENIDALMVLAAPRVDIKDIFMYVGSGQIKGRVSLNKVFSTNVFTARFNLIALELSELIAPSVGGYELSGKLNGEISAAGEHHALNPVSASLKGNGKFDVTQGKIEGLNVLKTVIDQLSFIPHVQQDLNERLPQKYKDKLEQKDTWIDVFSVDADFLGDRVAISGATLESSGFQVVANGEIDLEQDLFLDADFLMEADLTAVLLGDHADLAFLLDEEGRMRIPFKPYRGPAAALTMVPDIENLSKLALQHKGRSELRRAILKALDLEGSLANLAADQPGSVQGTPSPQPAPSRPRPEGALIEGVLDAIFKHGEF